MAQFDADIDLRVNVLDKELKALERRIKQLDKIANPAKKLTQSEAKVELAAAKQEFKLRQKNKQILQLQLNTQKALAKVEQDKAKTRAAAIAKAKQEIALVKEAQNYQQRLLRLENARQLQKARTTALERAGAFDVKSRAKEISAAQQVASKFPQNAAIQERVATTLGRILQTQNELNRAESKSVGQKQRIADYNKRINRLKELGTTEGELRKALKRRAEFEEAASRRQTAIADRRELQLKREIKLLEERRALEREVIRPSRLDGGARSPVQGSEDIPGSPKYKARARLLPNTRILGAAARGIKQIETSSERTARFVERTNLAYTKSAERAKDILEANRAAVKAGERNAKADKKAAERAKLLPDTKTLAAAARGIQRIETSSGRAARFAERTDAAYKRSAERSKDILEANKAAAKAGERNARAAENAAKANKRSETSLKNSIKSTRRIRKPGGRNNARLNNVTAGIGFPLLFGGGVGSVLGGGLGALGGFGPGILFSALGQAADSAAQQLTEFATNLTKASIDLEELTRAAGLQGTAAGRAIGFSDILGIPEAGRAAGTAQVESIIGKEGVKNLEDLSTESEKLGNAFAELSARVGAAVAPLLSGLARIGSSILGGSSQEQQEERTNTQIPQLRSTIERLEADGVSEAAISPYRRQLEELERKTEKVAESTKGLKDLNEQINTVVGDRIQLADANIALEQQSLSLRRDDLAARRGALEIQEIQNELTALDIRLSGELTKLKRQELELEKQITEKRKEQAEAAQANAVLQAQVQIEKEVIGLQNRFRSSQARQYQTELAIAALVEDEYTTYARRLAVENRLLEFRQKNLDKQLYADLLLVNEEEKRKAILDLYKQETATLEAQAELKREQIRQNEILRQDAEQAIKDQLKLQEIQTRINADQQIRATDPGRIGEFLGSGFGFFDQSNRFEADRIAESAEQLRVYNLQIENLEERIQKLSKKNVDPERILPFQNALDSLILTRDLYEELQPAIDQAAIAQQRFNDAFALVSPLTQSFVNNLREVVAGTKSVEQAFADFLNTIADQLAQTAAQMIAQYIALGIARAFATGSSPNVPNFSQGVNNPLGVASSSGFNLNAFAGYFANGGTIPSGQFGVVGENGPEFVSGPAKVTPMGAGTVVNITVNSNGTTNQSSSGKDAEEAAQLGRLIERSTLAIINREKRPGGTLAR